MGAPKELGSRAPSAPEKTIVQEGIFAPAVKLTVQVMGRKELNAFRASVIAEHTKVISKFVDTSESAFGQIALKSLFEAADKDDNGTLDKEEVKEALHAMGFKFIQDKQINTIFKKADQDNNDVIDFEELSRRRPRRCGYLSSSSPSRMGTTSVSSPRVWRKNQAWAWSTHGSIGESASHGAGEAQSQDLRC